MDRLRAMQVFARVVETGSFTKAAETLYLSRTTVTQLVQQLEAYLRVKLLNRTTRKVSATPDGAAYYEHVVRLLADIDDAETSLSSARSFPRGRLRVDVPSPFASMILVPALPDFHAKYPDIQLYLGASDREVDLIDENVDCVVRGGKITDLSLVARHAADLPLGVYAAPGYLEQRGHPNQPGELELPHHRTVSFSWSRTQRLFPHTISHNGKSMTVLGQPALVVDDGVVPQYQSALTQIAVDDLEQRRGYAVALKETTKIEDSGLVRNTVQIQTGKLTQKGCFVERLLHCRIAVAEPVLHQVHTQHGFQGIGWSSTFAPGVMRFDQRQHGSPVTA